MANNFSENPLPQIGIVTPSKELPINQKYKDTGLSPLEYFIEKFTPDWPGAFAAVYHHTVLRDERQLDSEPIKRKGETRYINQTPFPDPFTMLNMLAKVTTHAELYTAVLVAPQIQTADLAKKVADIANLSAGRFNLGVGVGWNKYEYDALGRGELFKIRGKVLNEQIPALRKILTGEIYTGRISPNENFDRVSINPAANFEVPVWVGGQSEAARKRAAYLGDGWMPLGDVDQFEEQIPLLNEYLLEAGRDPNDFKTMGRIAIGKTPSSDWVDTFLQWQRVGASHVVLTTTGNEDEYDPTGEKTDPYHHVRMITKFLKLTSWLRTPTGGFSGLFGESYSRDQLKLTEQFSDYITVKLDTDLKIEHIFAFLLARGFYETKIDEIELTTRTTEQTVVSQPRGLIGPDGIKVIFMNPINNPEEIYLLYNSKVELGFGNWHNF